MKSENEMKVGDELIAKYLSGEASPEEAMTIVDWLREPENKFHFEQFEKTWNAAIGKTKPTFKEQSAWSKIESSITSSSEIKNQIHVSWWASKAFRLAASLLIVAASAVFVTLKFNGKTKYAAASTQSDISAITLEDQSKITLFRFSSIEYPVQFKKNTREINFTKGEAFFQVAHDAQKPFIIHTPLADVKVIGTEFNVVIGKEQTEISVKEGKVLVLVSGDSTYLTGGQTGIFRQGKKNVTNHSADDNVWSYATRKLTFKDTPLNAVIEDIEKTYPCSISIANSDISKCKLTATFDNDSVDKIINLIAETLSLGVKRNGEVFILEGAGCP